MGRYSKRWPKKSGFNKYPKQEPAPLSELAHVVNELSDVQKSVHDREKVKAINKATKILVEATQATSTSDGESESSGRESTDSSDSGKSDKQEDRSSASKFLYRSSVWKHIIFLRDKKNWSYKHLAHRFKLLKTADNARKLLNRKREEFKAHKFSQEKVKDLDDSVWKIVSSMDDNYEVIHDGTIRKIASREAQKLDLKLKISESWVTRFKRRHRLCSRHIDVFVTNKKVLNSDEMKKTVDDYKKITWPSLRRQFPLNKIWNFDQSGLRMELIGQRTITRKGIPKVFRKVQRDSALTHSVTLHMGISADGILFPKTLVVLHEATLPKKFEKLRHSYKYLTIQNSPSGLMDAPKAIEWIESTFMPRIQNNSALVIDCWKGFNQMRALPSVSKKNLLIEILPAGTTSELQPLDTFFNRQIKQFIRRAEDDIRSCDPDFTISKRENLLALANLTLSQFAAPVFRDMIRYSWFSAGFGTTRPPTFVTPADLCFDFPADKNKCDVSSCTQETFILCAHCHHSRCFSHVLNHIH